MSNVIHRIRMTDDYILESYVCDTNELNPHRDTKELGIVLLKGDIQIDGMLDEVELREYIGYLKDCLTKIQSFNETSLPKD